MGLMRLLWDYYGTIARNNAGIARNITRNIHQTYWDLLEVILFGKTIGDIS